VKQPLNDSPPAIDHPTSCATQGALSTLLIAGLLFATVGGIGPTLNYLGFTMIRGYNRISVFLAFFALLAVAVAIERLAQNRRHKALFVTAMSCLLLALGLFDQISPRVVPQYDQNARDFRSDARLVASIEAAVPPGASIFQLPFMVYPESAPVNALGDYELFRGYLHSSTLHWSYGAVGGRDASHWQWSISTLPLPAFLTEVKAKGFAGIYLDRTAYRDDKTERSLESLLGNPLISDNDRLAFFKI
jgi:phosphoglycerol transferase